MKDDGRGSERSVDDSAASTEENTPLSMTRITMVDTVNLKHALYTTTDEVKVILILL